MRGRLAAEIDRELTAEQARAYLEQPISAREREDVLALVRWFTRRYATPASRLAYARRAYARWAASARPPRKRVMGAVPAFGKRDRPLREERRTRAGPPISQRVQAPKATFLARVAGR